jgi:hypothetical protein
MGNWMSLSLSLCQDSLSLPTVVFWVYDPFYSQDGGNVLLRHIGKHPPNYMISQSKLTCNREVPISSRVRQTGHPDWSFSDFTHFLAENVSCCLDIGYVPLLAHSSSSSFVNHPIIWCYIIRSTLILPLYKQVNKYTVCNPVNCNMILNRRENLKSFCFFWKRSLECQHKIMFMLI